MSLVLFLPILFRIPVIASGFFLVSVSEFYVLWITFQDFYEDIFEELSKYGEIENLNVCDNLADHMVSGLSMSLTGFDLDCIFFHL